MELLSEKIEKLLRKDGASLETAGMAVMKAWQAYSESFEKRSLFPKARWPKDAKDGETVDAFLRRNWGKLIAANRLSRSDLLRIDEKLYRHFYNWVRTHGCPDDLVIPTKIELRSKVASSEDPKASGVFAHAASSLANKLRHAHKLALE